MNEKCETEKEELRQEIDKLWKRITEMQEDMWRMQRRLNA